MLVHAVVPIICQVAASASADRCAGEPPYSTDANLLHISYEGNALEDPWEEAADDMWTRSVDVRDAPNEPEYVEIEFEKGDPVALNGERLSPAVMLTRLNELGGKHGELRLLLQVVLSQAQITPSQLLGCHA